MFVGWEGVGNLAKYFSVIFITPFLIQIASFGLILPQRKLAQPKRDCLNDGVDNLI
jgi:hypothetical protein